jgi:hypothetical protein
MIPETLATIMEICSDLYGKQVRDEDKLKKIIDTELWEGFVEDIRYELDIPDDFQIDPNWKVYELFKEVEKELSKEQEYTNPEKRIEIELYDLTDDQLLDDLEAILEKHDVPYFISVTSFEEGKPKQTISRSSETNSEPPR